MIYINSFSSIFFRCYSWSIITYYIRTIKLKHSKKRIKSVSSIFIVIEALLLMIAIGFTMGILSDAPDGLERVLIDQNGEPWFESLVSPWIPLFSWITNDYGAAILGIVLSYYCNVFYLLLNH